MLDVQIEQAIILVAGQWAALSVQHDHSPPSGPRLFDELAKSFDKAYELLAKRFSEHPWSRMEKMDTKVG